MNKINVFTSNSTVEPLYNATEYALYLSYPCSVTYNCTSYYFYLNPGKYLFDLYGAGAGATTGTTTLKREDSGTGCVSSYNASMFGGNAVCAPGNSAGSGGFISGSLVLKRKTKFFARIGGSGQVGKSSSTNDLKGGFNGGGSCMFCSDSPSTSGGGATDIRVEEDDLWHRIIVAGGGGGHDNAGAAAGTIDDGSGGAGGYPRGQSFWIDGEYQDKMYATQTYGFSFGQGESAQNLAYTHPNSSSSSAASDRAGAGGGWFGGHSSKHGNGGAGGGSSFILTKNAALPKGTIATHDDVYNNLSSKSYAFDNKSPYVMDLVSYANGIRSGNGFIKIALLYSSALCGKTCKKSYGFKPFISLLIIIIAK